MTMKEPFKFNYRRPKVCKSCGKTVAMLPRQKTCDECRKKLGLRKTSIPVLRPSL